MYRVVAQEWVDLKNSQPDQLDGLVFSEKKLQQVLIHSKLTSWLSNSVLVEPGQRRHWGIYTSSPDLQALNIFVFSE